MTLAAMLAFAAVAPANAAKQARQPAEAVAPREAGEPIMAIVSIKSQQVTFYDAEGWIFRAPVSTGTTGRETPAGVFAIIEKDKDHHSTMYDDAWMPNMQRITWNGIALHGGPLPGYAASHGCVRMPFGFAEGLFDKTNIGMRVIISPNDAAPIDIVHPALFMPKRDAIAAAPGQIGRLSGEAEEATRAADEAKKAATAAAKEAASLPASLRKLEQQKTRADAELAFADRQLAAAKTRSGPRQGRGAEAEGRHQGRRRGDAARCRQERRTTEARRGGCHERGRQGGSGQEGRCREGRDRRKARTRAGLGLHQPRDAEALRAAEHAQAGTGRRRRGVRHQHRGSRRDPQSGSAARHAYLHRDGEDRHRPALERGHDRRQRQRQERTRPHHHPTGGARSHRADRVAARSSIIISDEPLSSETNYRTEFVAVLSNQPQGGFITRKPTAPPMAMASDDGWDNGSNGFGFFFQRDPNPQPVNPRRRGQYQYYQPAQPMQRGFW
ncbi:hypothetical protein ACVWZ6_003148 [Bradyrhizobium sp. GM6.1]